MVQYLDKTKSLIQGFDRFTIKQVPRGDNKKVDALSKIASTSFAHLLKQVLVEILKNKSISEMEISTRKAQRFELRDGVLYRRSFLQPWLRCVRPLQADYVLREIHAGSCSMHSGPWSIVARALRSGYYWPTMHRDARDMIKKCSDCQVHRLIPRQPQQELTPITSLWPFYKWGIDIAGPFPVAAGGLKFLIVAIDYLTKWIEAKAVATITEAVIPAEIGMPTIRTAEVNVATNDDERRIDLDLLEERRERVAICEAKAKSKMKGYYDAKKMHENLDQSGKDPTKSLKHWEKAHTSCVTWMGVSCPAHGIFAISRDAIFRRSYGPRTDTFAP
ncbi:reverse transcriptase domain-containing protein [Tanacetum coccineum]|uniref:Reverse transcriptase domain-containing protein n=1 Tax=Tanacetum coccineum TaxID=301880 RepID=A0ABQ5I7K8_9ASTR